MHQSRIVITGVGLTSPNGNSLEEYRKNLLDGVARIQMIDMRYMGAKGAIGKVPAGVCDFDPKKHQTRKELRVGTRAGRHRNLRSSRSDRELRTRLENYDKSRIGVYVGTTEHGNVETENEVYNISKFDYDTKFGRTITIPARGQQPSW